MTENPTVPVKITAITDKGNGVGSAVKGSDTLISVEVPFTIPGDEVQVLLRRRKKSMYLGRLEAITVPSPDRIEPRCAHFGVCGGCRWQQVRYEQQLEFKEGIIRKTFGSLLDGVKVLPIVPSSKPWEYRNKMEFSFSSDIKGNRYLGLFMDNQKGKVLDLQECHLVRPWFSEALKVVRKWWAAADIEAYHPAKDKGSLRTLTLREGQRTGDRMVILTVSGNPDYALTRAQLDSFVAFLKEAIQPGGESRLSIFLRIQQAAKGMATNFYEMHLFGDEYIREKLEVTTAPNTSPVSLQFSIGPSSFFQPNTTQAEVLYSKAIQLAEIKPNDVVYDLYCGIGEIGICIATIAKEVVGVDISPESVLDARTNAAANQLKNVTIISGAVRHVLKQIQEEKKHPNPDVVMIDPPRPGLDPQAMEHLLTLKPPKIVYLSCNPKSHAVDIAQFVSNGYRLVAMQPVDHFPQTYHVENIAVLERV